METPTRRVRLGGRAFLWLAAGLLPAIFASPQEAVLGTLAIDLLLVGLFLYDAYRLRRVSLRVERELASRLRVGVSAPWLLRVTNASSVVLRLHVREALAENLRPEGEPGQATTGNQKLILKAAEQRELTGKLTPIARGTARLAQVALRAETRLGIAAVHLDAGEATEVRVLPAFGLDVAAQRVRRDELGGIAQRLRRAPQGSELESLREYVSQDPLRAIDWKATARRVRPVTRLYQPERSQTLWLVLDASRTMAQAVGERPASAAATVSARTGISKSRFDIAVEAALALADAALYAGDQVGLIVYADHCLSLVPPGHGRRHAVRLVDALSEVQALPVHLAVRSLLVDMERHARKRSLVVLFSDLENEIHGAAVCEHAPLLTRRHLAVCVNLQDMLIGRRAVLSPNSVSQVFHKAAAIDLLSERERLQRTLEKRGITVLEADVRGLSPKLLDHYLKVKLAARL
jgi:uncharacterized protein (DUF58 family)